MEEEGRAERRGRGEVNRKGEEHGRKRMKLEQGGCSIVQGLELASLQGVHSARANILVTSTGPGEQHCLCRTSVPGESSVAGITGLEALRSALGAHGPLDIGNGLTIR